MSISESHVSAPVHNPVIDALVNRRSCRSFKTEPVPAQVLDAIVICGQYAATARGLESRHLVVLEDPALIDDLCEAVRLGMRESGDPDLKALGENPDFHCFYHAPAVVIAASDGTPYGEIDCANSVMNMCVAAHSLGIGSCYNGFFRLAFSSSRGAGLLETLHIPDGHTPSLSVALGYPEGPVVGNSQRNDLKVTFLQRQ